MMLFALLYRIVHLNEESHKDNLTDKKGLGSDKGWNTKGWPEYQCCCRIRGKDQAVTQEIFSSTYTKVTEGKL